MILLYHSLNDKERSVCMPNPILNDKFLDTDAVLETQPMTVNGAINKTLILFALVMLPAAYTWSLVFQGFTDKASMLCIGGAIAGFILAMIIAFTRKAVNVLAPIYAVCEGFFVGGISAFFEASYTGIVIQAVAATFGTMIAMLLLYKAGAIRCTEKFRAVIFTATLSIAIIYLIQIVASLFGRGIPQIFTASPIGIGFSLLVVGIASLNLIVDFDFIEQGAQRMLPREYEWYGAFGLMVTIVWLYIEMLRLLAKLRDR